MMKTVEEIGFCELIAAKRSSSSNYIEYVETKHENCPYTSLSHDTAIQ